MREGFDRRTLLRGLGTGIGISAAGCLSDVNPSDDATGSEKETPQETRSITGIVTTASGDPLSGAAVAAIREGGEEIGRIETDAEGEFEIEVDRPVWLRVDHEDYLAETRAVGPGERVHQALTDGAGALSLQFMGDVMFGRRFHEPNDDPTAPRYRIDDRADLEDHREILRYTSPLLETGDVTSVNLETTLTTTEWRHPTKTYTYTSHPVAAQALADAGVDYAALGNNHVFDALDVGLEETIETLSDEGLAHSGAGFSPEAAWEPAYVEENGLTVAYLSCTTIVGLSNEIDWSADRSDSGEHVVEQDGERRTIDASIGVAEPTPARLREAIEGAREHAEVVVVQIHSGEPYQHDPPERLRTLSEGAIDSGADLVVNHHPHVLSGLETYGDGTIAWSLGNFVFDQGLWETLPSAVVTAHVTAEGVVKASMEPLLLEGYLPKGVTDRPRERILQRTASHSSPETALLGADLRTRPPEGTAKPSIDTERGRHSIGGTDAIYARDRGWIEEATTSTSDGTVRLGRDRLLTGDFENSDVDDDYFEGPLWRYGRGRTPTIDAGIGSDGSGGARLYRHESNEDRSFLSPRYRLPLPDTDREYTLSMLYTYSDDEGLEALVPWYDESRGDSFTTDSLTLDGTDGDWQRIVWHLEPPANATFINLFLFLDPPEDGGVREARFDDVRLIEWADSSVTGGREYDHLYLDGEATVTLATNHHSAAPAPELSWSSLSETSTAASDLTNENG